jgi:hypothetical protein
LKHLAPRSSTSSHFCLLIEEPSRITSRAAWLATSQRTFIGYPRPSETLPRTEDQTGGTNAFLQIVSLFESLDALYVVFRHISRRSDKQQCTSPSHTHIDIGLSHHQAQSYLYVCSVRWLCQKKKKANSSTAKYVIAGRTEKESLGQDSLADLILSELAITQVASSMSSLSDPQVGVRQDNNLGHGVMQLVDEILNDVCWCEGIEVSIR